MILICVEKIESVNNFFKNAVRYGKFIWDKGGNKPF